MKHNKNFLTEIDSFDNYHIIENLNKFSLNFEITDFINFHLNNLLEYKYYFPLNSSFKKYSILDSNKYDLSLLSLENTNNIESKLLYSYNTDIFLCPIEIKDNVKYDIFKQNKNCTVDILDESCKLELQETGDLINNKTIFIKNFYNVFSVDKSFHIYFLCLTKKESCDYIWEYDKNSLKPTKLISTNVVYNRLVTTLKILSEIGNLNSIDFINHNLDHKNHTLRWEAVKALINIDFEKGIKQLNIMKEDKHPEIRVAALYSLNMLSKNN
jgi:hypothetical protein